jgi:hypothetical protein
MMVNVRYKGKLYKGKVSYSKKWKCSIVVIWPTDARGPEMFEFAVKAVEEAIEMGRALTAC